MLFLAYITFDVKDTKTNQEWRVLHKYTALFISTRYIIK
ncbi:hypothetical protein EMIT074MI3_70033 [Bacillus licheniformis]